MASALVHVAGVLSCPAIQSRVHAADHNNAGNARTVGSPSPSPTPWRSLRSGQMSGVLARLARKGLLVKSAGGPGHANAWSLTPEGELVAQALRQIA